MGLQDIFNTSQHVGFIQRVRAAVFSAALAIAGENPAGPPVRSQEVVDKRHAVCLRVFADDGKTLSAFYSSVAANVGDVANPDTLSDTQIENSVSAVWDDIAGVKYGE